MRDNPRHHTPCHIAKATEGYYPIDPPRLVVREAAAASANTHSRTRPLVPSWRRRGGALGDAPGGPLWQQGLQQMHRKVWRVIEKK